MDLRSLRYFCAAAEAGSLTAAAERCHVAQPSISNAVAQLEQEFTLRLFSRSKRGVTLTPEGEAFYQEAARLLGSAGEMEQRFKRVELHKLNAMSGLAESVTCRRRVLLNYFGERLEQDCGNCDLCLDPPERFDATEAAQKALSCVYRVGQRFGVGHVVAVLRGADNERIRSLGHNKLSTWGIGSDRSEQEWTSIVRQLIHHGYLVQDIASYSVLKLTESARPLLRGEQSLELARPRIRERTAVKKRPAAAAAQGPYDEMLFEELRDLRKRLADKEGVPPYIVFGDATLIEMARNKPADENALLMVTGVGQHKLEKYGSRFLDAITAYCVAAG